MKYTRYEILFLPKQTLTNQIRKGCNPNIHRRIYRKGSAKNITVSEHNVPDGNDTKKIKGFIKAFFSPKNLKPNQHTQYPQHIEIS